MLGIDRQQTGSGRDVIDLSRRIRVGSLTAIHSAGSGHPGGSLSCADLLAYLWGRELSYSADAPQAQDRDRFILSKGHACPALYAAFAELDLIPAASLTTLRKLGSSLQGHPHVKDIPWVETSTGSLGQGFSVAVGVALGLRHQGGSSRSYVMLGDGEMQEGEVWEAAMCASHYKLDNLCGILDYNKMQTDDLNENIMRLEPLRAKWEAFNWHVIETDGHELEAIASAFEEARRTRLRPTMIIAHTIKGKGVSFMEGSPAWHGSVRLRDQELVRALQDLNVAENEIEECLHGPN